MNKYLSIFFGWFGWGGGLGDRKGRQVGAPGNSLVDGTTPLHTDGALQLSAVWACVQIIANTIASLPLVVYENKNGQREQARDTLLWDVLHNKPNRRMTPVQFWVAMLLNLLLRGNAYARIDRNAMGEVISLWPLAADQVEAFVLPDGAMVYVHAVENDRIVYAEQNILHLRELGNGTFGLSRLDYMRATTAEMANAQTCANALFANGGKATGVLTIDKVLNAEQRAAVKERFAEMTSGQSSRLFVLEADMKYQQLSLTPAETQLLETRKYGIEEIGRWFGVPSVLINHSGVTAWGTGIEQIIDGFFKFTIRPLLVGLDQSITKDVLTPAQRSRYTVEFNFDALLRASLKDRMEIYAKAVQNGLKTRNECRRLENDASLKGGDVITAQSNLVPLDMLGKVTTTGGSANAGSQDVIAQ
jgi:HK97 family phage portal protein